MPSLRLSYLFRFLEDLVQFLYNFCFFLSGESPFPRWLNTYVKLIAYVSENCNKLFTPILITVEKVLPTCSENQMCAEVKPLNIMKYSEKVIS